MIWRRQASVLLTVIAACFAATPLWAAEQPGEAKAGLPQLDATLFPDQLFWLAVSFVLLYLLMAFVGLPSVRRTQDNRKRTIGGELTSADAANKQAQVVLAQREAVLAEARTKAQAMIASVNLAAAKASVEQQTAQKTELMQRLHEAEAKIATARDAAIAETRGSVADLASLIIEKVAGFKAQVQR